jgi:uncharacterized membrane protein
MQNLAIVLVFGIPLSLIAATMVFLISYREYQHHFFERKKIIQISLESALFTLGFFTVLLLVIWLSINSMFPQSK